MTAALRRRLPMNGELLEAALGYAARGWRVLPCVPGKKLPLITQWQRRATIDADLLRRWWRLAPEANTGIATGPESGLLVLDVDGDPDKLLRGREIPRTPTQRTGGGGYQLFYRFPPELADVATTRAGVLPNVDTRGRGGFVVAPPSIHPDGPRYAWCDGYAPSDRSPVLPPRWLVDLLRPVRQRPSIPQTPEAVVHGTRYVQAAVERECLDLATAPEGTRNATLNRAAYALARFVAADEADAGSVVRALTYAATAAGLTEREITRTIESAFKARRAA
ncbi:hypothetical protein BH23GEM6_BH23GEM6_25910 [soil metagenome]